MEFIKEKIDDMTDPEPSRVKHKDAEEQTGWCPFLILQLRITGKTYLCKKKKKSAKVYYVASIYLKDINAILATLVFVRITTVLN